MIFRPTAVEDDARRQSEDMALSDLTAACAAEVLIMAIRNNFNGRAIRDGLRIREELKETPDTFGTRNSVGTQSNDKTQQRFPDGYG